MLSVVEFFGQALFFLFVGLETGFVDGAVIPFVPCEDRTYPKIFLLGDGIELVIVTTGTVEGDGLSRSEDLGRHVVQVESPRRAS